MNFKEKFELTQTCYEELELIINTCEKFDINRTNSWSVFYQDFWECSNKIPFEIDWCDPDSGYEDDMKARFKAVKEFVEQVRGEL